MRRVPRDVSDGSSMAFELSCRAHVETLSVKDLDCVIAAAGSEAGAGRVPFDAIG